MKVFLIIVIIVVVILFLISKNKRNKKIKENISTSENTRISNQSLYNEALDKLERERIDNIITDEQFKKLKNDLFIKYGLD